MSDGPPEGAFDAELATRLVGRRMLVGTTFKDSCGAVVERKQIHGVVEVADRRGIAVRRASDGGLDWFPPDTRSVRPAARGEYRLHSTGEVVRNPDFLMTWNVSSEEEQGPPREKRTGEALP